MAEHRLQLEHEKRLVDGSRTAAEPSRWTSTVSDRARQPIVRVRGVTLLRSSAGRHSTNSTEWPALIHRRGSAGPELSQARHGGPASRPSPPGRPIGGLPTAPPSRGTRPPGGPTQTLAARPGWRTDATARREPVDTHGPRLLQLRRPYERRRNL